MSHPNALSRGKTGLLVIDIQEKFRPAIIGFDEIVQNIVKLVLGFQLYKMPILVTEQYPQGLGRTVDIVRRQFAPHEPIVKKSFSCLGDKGFSTRLKGLGLDTLVVCGIESHVCVNQTVLDLLQRKMRVHVVVDAVSARRGLDHRMAMEKMMQVGAIPATTEMVLFELLGTAEAPEFKKIQRMVTTRLKVSGAGLSDASGLKNTSMFTTGEQRPKAEHGDNVGQPAAPAPAPHEEAAAQPMSQDEAEFESTSVMRQRARSDTAETAGPRQEAEPQPPSAPENTEKPQPPETDAASEMGPDEQMHDQDEEEVIDTVEIDHEMGGEVEEVGSEEAGSSETKNDSSPQQGRGSAKDASGSIPSDVEVLDIEALVDLRDPEESSSEGTNPPKK